MAGSELKTVVRHGRLYGLANLISRSSGLVLLPIYTHILTPLEFGLYASTILVTDLVSVVLGMGLGRALVRLHVEQQDETGKGAVLGTALAAFAVIAAVVALLAYPISLIASHLLFGSTDTAWLFVWAILALIPTTLFNIQLNYIVVLKQSSFYLIISVIKAALFIAFNLWLVVWLGQSVFGIIAATFAASAIVVSIILARMAHTTKLSVSRPILIEMVKFGGPLVPTVLLDTVMSSLDRYIISPVQGPAALGQYGLGLKLASLLNLFVTSPFLQIWGVRQLEALQEKGENRELPNVFFQFILVLIVICVGIALFSGMIVRIVADDAYMPAATVLPWLAAVQVAAALRNFGEIGLHHAKKTSPLMTIALVSVIVAAPSYWIAMRTGGIVGIAMACLGVMLFRTGLTMVWASRHSGLIRLFPWGRLTMATLVATITVSIGAAFDGRFPPLQEALLKLAALATCAALLGTLLGRSERPKEEAHAIPQVEDAG